MANVGYIISGGAPLVKKVKIGNTTAFATLTGVPTIHAATTASGIGPASTGTGLLYTGVTLDTATYTTTQSTSMVEGVVSIVCNPDVALRFRMAGSTTNGAALPVVTNTVASTGGTAVTITTGNIVPNSPTMLDGTIICLSGNNVGLRRKITTVSATVFTVLVPFPYTIAVGDTFTAVPYFPFANTILGGDDLTLTTLLTEADASVASTTAGFRSAHLDLQVDCAEPARAILEGYLLTNPVAKFLQQLV